MTSFVLTATPGYQLLHATIQYYLPHITLPVFHPIVAQFKASQPFMAVCA